VVVAELALLLYLTRKGVEADRPKTKEDGVGDGHEWELEVG